jgi:hypothetical protein
MELESVTLKLPRDLLSGAQAVASARDVTIGHMVRQLLKREVERQISKACRDTAPDPRLRVAVQALLARDMADALDWDDLARRLRPHGYEMRRVNGVSTLFKASCGTRVCAGVDLGFSYTSMVSRFGAELPDGAAQVGVMPAGNIDPTRRAMLTKHVAAARNWADLINRLACEGMELRVTGTALGIYTAATGRHLCNTQTVGAAYDVLVLKYGQRLPTDSAGPGTLRD